MINIYILYVTYILVDFFVNYTIYMFFYRMQYIFDFGCTIYIIHVRFIFQNFQNIFFIQFLFSIYSIFYIFLKLYIFF